MYVSAPLPRAPYKLVETSSASYPLVLSVAPVPGTADSDEASGASASKAKGIAGFCSVKWVVLSAVAVVLCVAVVVGWYPVVTMGYVMCSLASDVASSEARAYAYSPSSTYNVTLANGDINLVFFSPTMSSPPASVSSVTVDMTLYEQGDSGFSLVDINSEDATQLGIRVEQEGGLTSCVKADTTVYIPSFESGAGLYLSTGIGSVTVSCVGYTDSSDCPAALSFLGVTTGYGGVSIPGPLSVAAAVNVETHSGAVSVSGLECPGDVVFTQGGIWSGLELEGSVGGLSVDSSGGSVSASLSSCPYEAVVHTSRGSVDLDIDGCEGISFDARALMGSVTSEGTEAVCETDKPAHVTCTVGDTDASDVAEVEVSTGMGRVSFGWELD
ncbi:hypothetical protein KIPB_005993 [Kipferlia bialata]|uniref:Adhesin domain-containing protein n=1 Tax=Kipferlia bialata TaxID=797122 RepID=A0A9K3CWJ8_9EUKA|nr:hypothetical protein KIPB_005993 [Kipferlia bialata]|eukprot:g5993.t1